MIRIDDSLLEELGLIALPKAERDQILRQIYETLEMRVGMKLAERMSDQQLDEFERFIDTNDEAGALKWLETNFPDYKQVVANELEKLKTEIKRDAPQILAAMQQATAPVQQQPHQQQPMAPQPQTMPPTPVQPHAPSAAQQPQQPTTAYPPVGQGMPPQMHQPPAQPYQPSAQPTQNESSIPPPPAS